MKERFHVSSGGLTALVIAVVLPSFACGGGGAGDAEPVHHPDVLGNGERIAELNTRPIRPTEDDIVRVSGARIMFVDAYDETGEGRVGNVFLQDLTATPSANQGLLLFGAAYSPPSFRPGSGDVIDVSAKYSEFRIDLSFIPVDFTTPELTDGTVVQRFDPIDAPILPVVATSLPQDANEDVQLATFEGVPDLLDYQRGRPWISMLVTLENVLVAEGLSVDKAGRASVVLAPPPGTSIDAGLRPVITNELFDLNGSGLDIPSGVTLKRVTGFVTLFSKFQIAPRSAADIELGP